MPQLTADEIYSRLHVGNPGDLDFYKRVATDATSILEVGCGWGRLAGELSRIGVHVTGIDNNSTFLEKMRENFPDVDTVCGDVCSADSWNFGTRRFDLIIIPYNTLYSLGGRARIQQFLGLAKKFLSHTGELWLDVYPIDELHEALLSGYQPEEDDDEPVATWSDPDGLLLVRERTDFVQGEPALHVTYEVTQASIACGTLHMRHDYIPLDELVDLLEENGLSVTCLWGDFNGTPLGEEPEQIVVGAVLDESV